MSERFQVILQDLANAASTFHEEAATFRRIMEGGARPAPVETGDSHLDARLRELVEDMVTLHANLAAWIREDGDGLQRSHDDYQRADLSVSEIYDELMRNWVASGGPR